MHLRMRSALGWCLSEPRHPTPRRDPHDMDRVADQVGGALIYLGAFTELLEVDNMEHPVSRRDPSSFVEPP